MIGVYELQPSKTCVIFLSNGRFTIINDNDNDIWINKWIFSGLFNFV